MRAYPAAKRIVDVVVAGAGLALSSPVLGVIAAAIWTEDRGPVFFRHQRVGQNGEPFELLKFRSMSVDTASVSSADAVDVRITRVGKVIRRLNLDEMPQLVNVLRGDMSLVGPRPALASQERLCQLRQESGVVHCRPGLTGLAQVNAYTGMPEDEKAKWDAEYARQMSLKLDAKILLRTVGYLMRPPPVY